MATGFLRAAKALAEPPDNTVEALVRAFAAAMEGIQARGKAAVGDRTLVDGLDAVSNSLGLSLSAVSARGSAGPSGPRRFGFGRGHGRDGAQGGAGQLGTQTG